MTKKEQTSTTRQPQPIPVPDGKSGLPDELPDYEPLTQDTSNAPSQTNTGKK